MDGDELTATLELLRNRGALLTERFFDRLFRDYPSTRAFLDSLDDGARQRMVLSAIALMADVGQNPGQLHGYVPRLARRHLDYGATPESLQAFVTTLVLTIAELVGPAWTEQAAAAWREAANRLASVMLRALEQPAAEESFQSGLQG